MQRGEVWTAAGGKDYPGKPRPVVIVQDDDLVPKSKLGTLIGRLDDGNLLRLNRALLVFLGLAG